MEPLFNTWIEPLAQPFSVKLWGFVLFVFVIFAAGWGVGPSILESFVSGEHPFLFLNSVTLSMNFPHLEPPAGLLMDQSLRRGPAMQTQSIPEELSSPVAICVMMMRKTCFYTTFLFAEHFRCVVWLSLFSCFLFPLQFPFWSHFLPSIPLYPTLLCFFRVIGESGTKL